MDFLDNIVLPQSSDQLILMEYIMVMTLTLLIPYLGILTGANIYSIYFNRKFKKTGDVSLNIISKAIIDAATPNKSIPFALGFVPLISLVFIYTQLTQKSAADPQFALFLTIFLFIPAVVFLYTYKYSFHLKDIFETFKTGENGHNEDLEEYRQKASGLYTGSAKYSLVFLLLTMWIISGTTQGALNPDAAKEGLSLGVVLFSPATITYFLFWLGASFLAASVYLFYLYFKPEAKGEKLPENIKLYLRDFLIKSSLLFLFVVPGFYTINLILRPAQALSSGVFMFFFFSFFALILLGGFLYTMYRESHNKYTNGTILVLILFFTFGIIKDQYSFNSSSRDYFLLSSKDYFSLKADMQKMYGAGIIEISGEDIFNGRCIACHQFDKKLTGPPYNTVLPKYDGKMDNLVKFILNPVKVNPEYTAMPSQGLNPKEAEAVADYIMETWKSQK